MAIDLGSESTLDYAATTWEAELTAEQMEMLNEMMVQSVGTDMGGSLQLLGYLSVGINVLYVIFFITTAIGLYKLSKKLGDEHSWLAFIPVIQLYTFIKTAGYNFWKGFLLLVLFLVLAIIGGGILLTVLSAIIASMFMSTANLGTVMIISMLMWFLVGTLMMVAASLFLYLGMARRAWQSNGIAVLMAFFPWCMLWIVANRIQPSAQETSPADEVVIDTGM